MEKYVVIVAAGKGLRMGSNTPKQFLPLAGKPLLMHTLENFYAYNTQIHILVVLPQVYVEMWKKLCLDHHFQIPHQIVVGGEERSISVKNAMQHIPDTVLVAVHDGVRPFVNHAVIDHVFQKAHEFQSAIPVIPPTDTIRLLEGENSKTLDRNSLRLVQTPQCFQSAILKKAYNQVQLGDCFTDDASLVEEKLGISPALADGNIENMKITHAQDFLIAELYLKEKNR